MAKNNKWEIYLDLISLMFISALTGYGYFHLSGYTFLAHCLTAVSTSMIFGLYLIARASKFQIK
jgi:hypothetical protein